MTASFVASLVLHCLLLLLFALLPFSVPSPAPQAPIEVTLLPTPLSDSLRTETPEPPTQLPPPIAAQPPVAEKPQPKSPELPKEQIVEPPDQLNDQAPDKTRFLSDRNTTAKKETVASGVPHPRPPAQPERAPQERKAKEKPPTRLAMKPPTPAPKPQPRPEHQSKDALGETAPPQPQPARTPEAPAHAPQLFARFDDLVAQGLIPSQGEEQEETEHRTPTGGELMAAVPPPRDSLLSLLGPPGTPDFLPDVQQGNLTLLNTKANRFAPFVRRVAHRVFQHLIIHQRKYLSTNDVVAAHGAVTLEVKLDAKGTLKDLIISSRSGSHSVDESLLKACENGAWDENPPAEAKNADGYIHFIFRSDINAQYDDFGLRTIITYLQVGLV